MEEKDQNSLFKEFPAVSTDAWEDKIKADLKGADYDRKLLWRTGEGFNAKPYYRSKDLEPLSYLETYPGSFPFTRGRQAVGNDWYIRQDIRVDDVSAANAKALDILMKGVNSLGLVLDESHDYSGEELDQLLKNIFAEMVEINFVCGKNAVRVMGSHYDMLTRYNRDFQKIFGSIEFDPLGKLISDGRFYNSEEDDFNAAKELIDRAAHLPHFTVLSVHGERFHNAGATITEELAYSLSAGADYLTRLTEMGLSVTEVAPRIKFSFAIGSNYFMEIARIRAARLLWAHIVKAYGAGNEEVKPMNLHAVTSAWNMTVYDPYVNMLRTTTEAMSSIIAGINSLTVRPFNSVYEEPAEFSERIARNQQLLLKEESYFDKVADPAAGSYYIESLVDAIAEEAWNIFLEVDSKGGFLQAVREGFVQERIEESANKRYQAVSTRKEVLLGTNKYPDFNEHRTEFADEKVFPRHEDPVKAEVARLKPFRGATGFEQVRFRTDKYALQHKRPLVFMLTYGDLAMRVARSQFARNFFACAGFDVVDNLGFESIEEGVAESIEMKADIVVVCSSDKEYADIVPGIFELLHDRALLVVAGQPKESVEEFKKLGIKHFIHMKSNVLETLQEFQDLLNM